MKIKYLKFCYKVGGSWEVIGGPKTYSESGLHLPDLPGGIIKWCNIWEKYCYYPSTDYPTSLGPICLREIADFCEKQTQKKNKVKHVRTN